MRRNKSLKFCFVIILVVIVVCTIPSAYAFYFSKYESSITSKFTLNKTMDISYVRATVLTYWVDKSFCEDENDLTTCALSGKNSWNLNTSVINSGWTKLSDGYYYYNSPVNSDEITKENIKTSDIVLIDSDLSLEDLTDDYLTGTNVVPQYEIIYEIIEKDGVSDAWKVTYENGAPEMISNS